MNRMVCKTTQFFLISQKYTMCSVEKHAILQKRPDICKNTINLIEGGQNAKLGHWL